MLHPPVGTPRTLLSSNVRVLLRDFEKSRKLILRLAGVKIEQDGSEVQRQESVLRVTRAQHLLNQRPYLERVEVPSIWSAKESA